MYQEMVPWRTNTFHCKYLFIFTTNHELIYYNKLHLEFGTASNIAVIF